MFTHFPDWRLLACLAPSQVYTAVYHSPFVAALWRLFASHLDGASLAQLLQESKEALVAEAPWSEAEWNGLQLLDLTIREPLYSCWC